MVTCFGSILLMTVQSRGCKMLQRRHSRNEWMKLCSQEIRLCEDSAAIRRRSSSTRRGSTPIRLLLAGHSVTMTKHNTGHWLAPLAQQPHWPIYLFTYVSTYLCTYLLTYLFIYFNYLFIWAAVQQRKHWLWPMDNGSPRKKCLLSNKQDILNPQILNMINSKFFGQV